MMLNSGMAVPDQRNLFITTTQARGIWLFREPRPKRMRTLVARQAIGATGHEAFRLKKMPIVLGFEEALPPPVPVLSVHHMSCGGLVQNLRASLTRSLAVGLN